MLGSDFWEQECKQTVMSEVVCMILAVLCLGKKKEKLKGKKATKAGENSAKLSFLPRCHEAERKF